MKAPNETGNKTGNRRVFRWALIAAAVVVGALCLAILRNGSRSSEALNTGPTTVVRCGPLTINVAESGTIHPREQMILRNDLDRDAKITFIVDEGKQVKKGELLVKLDVTMLEEFVVERRIRVQTAEAQLVYAEENLKVVENQGQADIEQAELTWKFAQQDLQKYTDGEYPRLVKAAEAKITLAKQELSRANDVLGWSKRLYEEKYLARSELQRDELTANRADLDLQLAEADLELLKNYTYTRQIEQVRSDVRQAEMALERAKRKHAATMAQADAQLKAQRARYEDERAELKEDEDEIARATICAPIDGMVLYASSVEDWDEDLPQIQQGAIADQNREIIYLPTTSAFNADVKTLEVNLRKVGVELPARIMVDAIPGKVFPGRVTQIAPLPDPDNWFSNPNLKVYNTVISVDANDPALRNGMSCRVEILVQHYPDAVYVPVQTVTRVNGQPTVYVLVDGRLIPRPVDIGLDNNRLVHVLSGLEAGEVVSLAPPLASGDSDDRADEPNEASGAQQGKGNPS